MPRASRSARAGHSPDALDVAAFCRDEGRLEGRWPIEDLARLAGSVLRGADGATAGSLEWRAAGTTQAVHGGLAQCVVDLAIRATPQLECQRCLQPMAVPLAIERRIRFVAGEDEAARLDEESDDDVLALTRRFDLRELIEDEVLLGLPLVPRHEACPDLPVALRDEPAAAAGEGAVGTAAGHPAEHPFAALAALRRGKG